MPLLSDMILTRSTDRNNHRNITDISFNSTDISKMIFHWFAIHVKNNKITKQIVYEHLTSRLPAYHDMIHFKKLNTLTPGKCSFKSLIITLKGNVNLNFWSLFIWQIYPSKLSLVYCNLNRRLFFCNALAQGTTESKFPSKQCIEEIRNT